MHVLKSITIKNRYSCLFWTNSYSTLDKQSQNVKLQHKTYTSGSQNPTPPVWHSCATTASFTCESDSNNSLHTLCNSNTDFRFIASIVSM